MRRIESFVLFLALAGGIISSCGGEKEEDTVQESISVAPSSIDAVKDMANYKVTVSSNTSWTVSFSDEDGKDVTWAVLDRKTGNGDAVITLRIYENSYKSNRRANLAVTTKGGLSASVAVTQKGDESSGQQHAEAKFRVGTYNMRGSWLKEDKEENAWEVRKDRMLLSLQDCAFDIVGLQEVGTAAQSWLTSTFSGTYSFKFFSPYSQDGDGDRGQGIAWKKDAFTMSGWHYFWLGSDPGSMSTNDTGSQGNYNRGGCCCVLTHKATGIKLFFMNNHGCMNADARKAYASQFESMERTWNVDGLPSFFVGDMNSSEDTEQGSPYAVYTSYWKDAFKEVPTGKRSGNMTFNGYSAPTGKSRIDMIFFRGDNSISIDTYTCLYTLYSGMYASDHFPVFADVTIKN